MNKETKDTTGKWAEPTSSYEDAKAISRLVKKVKDQKAQDVKQSPIINKTKKD